MVKRQLGQRIAALRKDKGFTQESFSEACAYSVEFISLVERGINSPSIEGCERMARALDVSLKELFDFDS